MLSKPIPLTHNLVLIGGGHSHAILLKRWGMNPIPGVYLTLISDTSHTPYSGMLPGHVAGFYTFEETHIDLRRLARFSQAQFYLDQAIGLNLDNNQVICANHPPISFDYLSIDIGSTPNNNNITGASQYSIPAKPVPQFLAAWNQLIETVENNPKNIYKITIVGGGAGGVELALNMQTHLQAILEKAQQPLSNLIIHIFHQGQTLLTGHNSWVSGRLEHILSSRGINIHLNTKVSKLEKISENNYQVFCESGLNVTCDIIFWVTQASSPKWIKESGIKTDEKGFMLVNDYLQSVSHSHIFAAGDIATMEHYIRPKAGVFAVRQGKPLFENLQRIILGESLKAYHPQKYYLSLIGTGNKKAIASWGAFGLESSCLWHWKDYIDRKFMNQFKDLPVMSSELNSSQKTQLKTENKQEFSACAGCASKVGSQILERTLNRLNFIQNPEIVIGLKSPDDGAVIKLNSEKLLVQTIDLFPSLVSDPFIFGQITANHCLSDLWAMGATAHSVLAVVTLPYGDDKIVEEILYQLLQGCLKVINNAQVSLIGGHTLQGPELGFGLSCNGLVSPENLLRKSGMKSGDLLILTKAIGTGTLFAAEMIYQAKGSWIDKAIESMLISNQKASEILLEFGATACTDITGFGLLGHLSEMMKASQVSVKLDLEKIPILLGAIDTIQQGIFSSLHPQNLAAATYISNREKAIKFPKYPLLFDPQTSGGLLASIPQENAEKCLHKLINLGYNESSIIGKILDKSSEPLLTLTLREFNE
ncbi:selenide, water dikinase SelD [Crocosphaera sp. XPORK-15E]|uniref:selenide, water dikinase SelD n=1 Tax=Crocosphaera sp. XPORK-15E TaxID=3110247 RepID=UPI002B21667E|nr:selenide, water dikinase SelD [Crocosphaera sp. XPORK-15E]MEA5533477.1 selenide, water dikinase SelD [Crocosphaera sp. XPORK-15E]